MKTNGFKKKSLKKKDLSTSSIILEPEKLKTLVDNLNLETDNEIKCQIIEKIVQMIVENEIDSEFLSLLASHLTSILSIQINEDFFTDKNKSNESQMDSISSPLFVMFRNQFQLCKEEDNRKKLLSRFLVELQAIQPKIGYLLLYFLKVWSIEEKKRESEQR